MFDLHSIEAIKQLKARYFRALDCKQWSLMQDCLAAHCTARYDGGKYSFSGRDEIVGFFRTFMDDPQLIFMHQGHHPEITVIDDNNAEGIWYLQDKVINLHNNTILNGAGFYHDRYVRVDGQWLISETGYQRTFEETEQRDLIHLGYNRFASTDLPSTADKA